MDARYCALSRVSSGLIAGGAGVSSGDILRAPSAPGRSSSAGLDTASSAFAPGQCGYSPGLCGLALRPCGLPLPSIFAREACLSHLAGVGHRSLAIDHGCSVGQLAGVLDRWPVSPLPSTPACSAAGSWGGLGLARLRVGRRRRRILRGSGAVAPAFARARSAGPSPVWRIASGARLRRSRGYRTERGLSAGRHHCGCAFGQIGSQPEPGPMGARSSWKQGRAGSRDGLPRSCSPIPTGHWPAHSRQAACGRMRHHSSPSAPSPGPWAPGGRGLGRGLRQVGDHGAITAHVCPGHGPGPRMRMIMTA